MDFKLKMILGFLGTVLVLGLGTGLIVKVLALGSSSSEDNYNVEPRSDVHRSDTEVFDFSNTKITGSAIMGFLAFILILSYMSPALCSNTCLFSTFVFSGVSNGMPLQRKQGQVLKNPLPRLNRNSSGHSDELTLK